MEIWRYEKGGRPKATVLNDVTDRDMEI